MIRRMRRWAMLWPRVMVVMALLAFAASASQGPPEYVTAAEMERYFLTKGLSFGAALLGGIWIIYGALERAREKKEEVREKKEQERWDNITKVIETMASNVSILAKSIHDHNDDASAHYNASKANHAPIEEMIRDLHVGIDELKRGQSQASIALAELVAEHNIIRENECNILRVRRERTRKDDPPDLDTAAIGRSEA